MRNCIGFAASSIGAMARHAIAVGSVLTACGRDPAPGHLERRSHAEPPRFASRAVLADEMLWSLGPAVRAQTIGVSELADKQEYSSVVGCWPASVTRLGPNPDEALALDPEIVILGSFTTDEYRSALRGSVRIVDMTGFTGFGGYLDNLELVAAAVGAAEAGTVLRDTFAARIAEIERRRPASGVQPSCIAWAYDSIAGAHTTFDAVATVAGCRNVAATAGVEGHQRVDAEQLVAWDPDFVVLSCYDADGPSCDRSRANFAGRPGFARLRAVMTDQLVLIPPPYLSTTGAGMADLAALVQAGITNSRTVASLVPDLGPMPCAP